jgi:hypothetical protein
MRRWLCHIVLLAAIALALVVASLLPIAAAAQEEMSQGGSPAPPGIEADVDASDVTSPAQVPSASPGQPLPADVRVQAGDTVTLDNGALLVTFSQVTEDSRCPKDVMCVWMGRAVVSLHVVVDGVDRGDVAAELYAGPRNPRSPDRAVMVDRYRLSLTDLQPYPTASTAGKRDPVNAYVATLHVAINAP